MQSDPLAPLLSRGNAWTWSGWMQIWFCSPYHSGLGIIRRKQCAFRPSWRLSVVFCSQLHLNSMFHPLQYFGATYRLWLGWFGATWWQFQSKDHLINSGRALFCRETVVAESWVIQRGSGKDAKGLWWNYNQVAHLVVAHARVPDHPIQFQYKRAPSQLFRESSLGLIHLFDH